LPVPEWLASPPPPVAQVFVDPDKA
jgi:hypothetical protein